MRGRIDQDLIDSKACESNQPAKDSPNHIPDQLNTAVVDFYAVELEKVEIRIFSNPPGIRAHPNPKKIVNKAFQSPEQQELPFGLWRFGGYEIGLNAEIKAINEGDDGIVELSLPSS
ncbi:MAG: hypothetical protein IPN69_06720 [Acidobacteria bacterium]|nr:hypothetical protein [Acidobacteriota bacterium]